ncbi:MAG: hypothetical protein HOP21_02270 [Methylotenera sp.]|nr:hypothetical protein [Methylotenera sp.]
MNENLTSTINQKHLVLLATLRQLMKPLVRLLLSHGVTYPLLLEELKRVFVEVAEREYPIHNKPQTDSRITLLTGVHRRDVNRIRQAHQPELTPKSNFSSLLIAQWIGHPRFIDENGLPKKLPKMSVVEGEESFDSLIASVSKDIRARPVLDEWLRAGIIEVDAQANLQLNTEAFIPKENLEEKLFFLGMNGHDHLASAVHNVMDIKPSMMERCVYYDGLDAAQIAHIQALAKSKGMEYLKKINQEALLLETEGLEKSLGSIEKPMFRMNTGVYFYFEPSSENQKKET